MKEIARRRMRAQRLWGRPLAAPEDVVRHLGAMQAQEFAFAKWSVAQRTKGVDDDAMERAFAEGRILRTHVLRPTWHFVLPEDLRWMLGLTAPRVHAGSAARYRELEVDDRLVARTNAIIEKALAGGTHLTRNELRDVLERAGIATGGQRIAYLVMRAELDAVICSGPRRGKQHTYALVDERAPNPKRLDPEEALAELTRRYFTARGPATVRDYRAWSSLTAAQARRGLEIVGRDLEQTEAEGRTYWFGPDARRAPAPARSPRFDLVQIYDETIMGYTESRDALYDASTVDRTAAYREAWMHGILRDGRLIGRWKPADRREKVVVETTFFRPLTAAQTPAFEAALERYAAFRGQPVTRG